jgi:hypothetical protein
VNRESELPQSALHGYTEAPGIVSFVEPDDDVIGVTRPLTALMRPPITFPESSSSATAMMYPAAEYCRPARHQTKQRDPCCW